MGPPEKDPLGRDPGCYLPARTPLPSMSDLSWGPCGIPSTHLLSSCWISWRAWTASCSLLSCCFSFPHHEHGLRPPRQGGAGRGKTWAGNGKSGVNHYTELYKVSWATTTPWASRDQSLCGKSLSLPDGSGLDSGLDMLLSVLWLWPDGYSLALWSLCSGLAGSLQG